MLHESFWSHWLDVWLVVGVAFTNSLRSRVSVREYFVKDSSSFAIPTFCSANSQDPQEKFGASKVDGWASSFSDKYFGRESRSIKYPWVA